MCTWEGDNTVMAQQTARYVVQALQSAMKGKKPSGSAAYLANVQQILASKFETAGKVFDIYFNFLLFIQFFF